MTKPFYSDPLKAAIMARDFGVSYEPPLADWSVPLGIARTCADGQYWFYIHPDSLHIFDPREGDIIRSYYEPGEYECWTYRGDADAGHLATRSYWEIIMRDGKHFFMPKEESSDD